MRLSIDWRITGLASVLLFCSIIYAQPQLSSPSNGAQNRQVTLTLSWQALSGSGSYDVEVATSSDLSGTSAVFQITSNTAAQPVLGLSNGKTFYWSVRGYGSLGNYKWAGAWSFSTVALAPGTPIAPALSSPSNGTFGEPGLTLSWHSVSNATSYGLQISVNSTFLDSFDNHYPKLIKYDITSIYYSNIDSIPLTDGEGITSPWYWRVDASNAIGTGPWSSVWRYYLPGNEVLPVVKQTKLRQASNNFRIGFTKLLAHANTIEAYSLKGEKMNSELLRRINGIVLYRYVPGSAGHE